MTDSPRIESTARQLREAWKSRTPCAAPSDGDGTLSIDDAYAIQKLNLVHRLQYGGMDGEPVTRVGYKVGLTSHALQDWLDVDQPDFGGLLSDMEIPDAGEASFDVLLQPRIEAELAFVLGDDLEGPGVTPSRVVAATAYVLPALEIIDSRIADWDLTYEDTVADNASSGLFVCGTRPMSLAEIDLRLIGMAMRRNGRVVSTGAGAACLGQPAAAVAWLANALGRYEAALTAGDVVLSGALGPVATVERGDWFEAAIGPASVTVRVS